MSVFPKISIIIPTYKRPDSINEAVENCLSQTYENKEIIVIDDNGLNTDYQKRTQKNLRKYINSDEIKYFPLKDNWGACAARNFGIKKSSGKYIAFFDDDDEWTLDKIEKQFEVFAQSDDHLGIVVCSQKVVDVNANKEITTTHYNTLEYNTFEILLNSSITFATPNPLFRRSALISVNGFTENLESSQDLDLSLKIIKKFNLKSIPKVCHIVKIHNGERISTNHWKKISGFKYILEQYADDLNDAGKMLYLKRIIMHCYYGKIVDDLEVYVEQLIQLNGFTLKYRFFYLGTKTKFLRIILDGYIKTANYLR
ncbi:glycosyltransferase family 2 protein [uncultured Sunxiuqinia sp.]|uniref:glycosyltransferase family 2 protein n=1 Tax=uncultured Sunxiuqinia sp. TaxID=1573825 RepID=UPI002AA88917|nr:glycosyltransferase family 2 protein [uncultured Sunxiuqinia sp.]